MELQNSFTDFLGKIRLTGQQSSDCESAHTELRDRLETDPDWKSRIVDTFLQGSYRRSTVVTTLSEADRVDVDVVVVTNLHEAQYTPRDVVTLLTPFLERNYRGRWEVHDRSICLQIPGTQVELDLVVTSAPSEAVMRMIKSAAVSGQWTLGQDADWKLVEGWEPKAQREVRPELLEQFLRKIAAAPEWKADPLRIPARDLGHWVDTNPLEQIKWTREKNAETDGYFISVVKAIKWWRLRNNLPKYPKGYPLEQLVGELCSDGITSVAQGLTTSLELIAANGSVKPHVADPGVPANDVLARVGDEDYAGFWSITRDAAKKARAALDLSDFGESALAWQGLLGPEFPVPDSAKGGFSPRVAPSTVTTGRFGIERNG